MEAFTYVPSTGGFVEAPVEASVEDKEDVTGSTEATSMLAVTKASTKASMEVTFMKDSIEVFIEVMEAFAEVMEAFTEVTSTEAFMEAFMEIMGTFTDVTLLKLSWKLSWK